MGQQLRYSCEFADAAGNRGIRRPHQAGILGQAFVLPQTPAIFAGIAVLQGYFKTKTPTWVLWAVAAFFIVGELAMDLSEHIGAHGSRRG